MIDKETFDAVKAYQAHMRSSDSTIMFPPENGSNPANKWTKMLTKFYKKHYDSKESRLPNNVGNRVL